MKPKCYRLPGIINSSTTRPEPKGSTVRPRFNDPFCQRSVLSTSKQYCPTVTCCPSALPSVWFIYEYDPTRHIGTDRHLRKSTTALFVIWGSNEDAATALNFSALFGACYVTRWQGQGSLGSGFTRHEATCWALPPLISFCSRSNRILIPATCSVEFHFNNI
jgi:hypothetical protein